MKGKIYQRAENRFFIKIDGLVISRDDQNEMLDTRDRAERMLSAVRYLKDNHLFDKSKYTRDKKHKRFEDAFKSWANTKHGSYKESIDSIYRTHFQYLKGMYVEDIHTLHITQLEDTIRGSKSYSSIMKILRAFIKRYWYLHDLKQILPKFEKIPDSAHREGWLTEEEQELVLQKLPKHYLPIMKFCMQYGCRPCEAVALDWKDVSTNTVTMRHTKTGKVTVLPLIPEVIPQRQALSGVVFTDRKGNQFHRYNMTSVWNQAVKKAGIKKVCLYEGTRHSFASQRASSGMSLFLIGKVLGHSKPNITERYAKASQESLEKVINIKRKKTGNTVSDEPENNG
jgi:integrase